MAFPPVRTLILSPTFWHSRTATPSATVGTLFNPTEFPLTAVVDGDTDVICRFATTAAGVALTFPGSVSLNLLGLCHHNLDPHVLVQAYVNGSLLPLTFSVQYPNCWIDLRAFADVGNADSALSATSVELRVYGNSAPVSFGEIVAGMAYRFDGTIELPFQEGYGTVTVRDYTEQRKTLEWGSGVTTRRLALRVQASLDDWANLNAVTTVCGTTGAKAVVVPTTRRNDLWLVRWPNLLTPEFPNAVQVTVPIDLVEEPGSVLV